MLAVIGGSGLYGLTGLESGAGEPPETPYGKASAAISLGQLSPSGRQVAFLARHGTDHRFAPHRVPYRANIWALREAGASEIVAVNSVGSLRPQWQPGSLVLPDQLIDYTWGRESTFAAADDPVVHLDFTHPYSPELRQRVLRAAAAVGEEIIDGATYGATQGPRFETPAEIRRMQRDGCDLVGMTGMPEAILAREAGLAYCAICVAGNLAAGLAGPDQVLRQEEVAATTADSLDAVVRIIAAIDGT